MFEGGVEPQKWFWGDIGGLLLGCVLPPPNLGPVFVELPIDVLYPFHVVEKEIGGTKSARGLRGKAVQW